MLSSVDYSNSPATKECLTVCPACILIFSGKRKSGKDYVTDLLFNRCGHEAVKVHLSAPIKSHWAATRGLDLKALLGSGEYKEHHRQEMIHWGEMMRKKDPGYFCKPALQMSDALYKKIWIITDARRLSDLCWFHDNYGGEDRIRTVRINASEQIRSQRGWAFTSGIDDAESECDLDSVTSWDWTIENNGDIHSLEVTLDEILNWIQIKINC